MADAIRIITVNATGDRYILKQVDFKDGIAFCMGEMTSYKGPCRLKSGGYGFATRHDGTKRFKLDKVTIETVEKDRDLCDALFAQCAENCGYNYRTTRGGNVQLLPTTADERRRNLGRIHARKTITRKLAAVASADAALDLAVEAEEKNLPTLAARAMELAAGF